MGSLEIRPKLVDEDDMCAARVVYSRRMARIVAANSQRIRDAAKQFYNPMTAGVAMAKATISALNGDTVKDMQPDDGLVELGRAIEGCAQCPLGKIICENTVQGINFAVDNGGYEPK